MGKRDKEHIRVLYYSEDTQIGKGTKQNAIKAQKQMNTQINNELKSTPTTNRHTKRQTNKEATKTKKQTNEQTKKQRLN